jgi:peptidylprolyl isomerase
VAGGFGADPKITIPKGCAPARTLLSKDLVAGSGPGVKDGGTVVVNYQVVTWSDSHVQDSSFTSGTPFPLENVGHAGVIQGWNQGLIGIQKGARRLLIVPPSLGYPNGRGTIKPGETLVFVIDAVSVA